MRRRPSDCYDATLLVDNKGPGLLARRVTGEALLARKLSAEPATRGKGKDTKRAREKAKLKKKKKKQQQQAAAAAEEGEKLRAKQKQKTLVQQPSGVFASLRSKLSGIFGGRDKGVTKVEGAAAKTVGPERKLERLASRKLSKASDLGKRGKLMASRQHSRNSDVGGKKAQQQKHREQQPQPPPPPPPPQQQQQQQQRELHRLARRLPSRNTAPSLLENVQADAAAQRADRPRLEKITLRASSSPALVAFTATYVNRLKACPLSLGEKLSRWCRTSGVALFQGHPPDDHSVAFPNTPYRDFLAERKTELERAGHAVSVGAVARVEVVLQRYPDGRHGLSPTRAAAPTEAADRGLDRVMLPPPRYDTVMSTPRVGEVAEDTPPVTRPRSVVLQMPSFYAETDHEPAGPQTPAVPTARRRSSTSSAADPAAGAAPPPVLRRGSNDSMAARKGSSWDLTRGISPFNLPGPCPPIAEEYEGSSSRRSQREATTAEESGVEA